MSHLLMQRTVIDPDILPFRRLPVGGGIVLDIGAHWGYTAASLRFAGVALPIYSVEAMPCHQECLGELRQADDLFDFGIVALSDSHRRLELLCPVVNGVGLTGQNSSAGGTLTHHNVIHAPQTFWDEVPDDPQCRLQIGRAIVDAVTLDEHLATTRARWPLFPVAGIKIDVEAHEPEVLRGASSTLVAHRPLLMIEGANRVPEVVDYLTTLGYAFARVKGDVIQPQTELSMDINGYFFHISRAAEYMSLGLLQP